MISDMNTNTNLLSRQQTAEILGLQPQTLASWACQNGPERDLPVIKIGRLARYRREDIERFIENGRTAAKK